MFGYDERNLTELFSNPIRGETESYFRVPRFQRRYEWEKEREVIRLKEDVFANLGHTYFMGPIILRSKPGEPSVEIIDGQQRLVTFAIFFRAFVDYIKKRINGGAFPEEALCDKARNLQHGLRSKIIKGVKTETAVVHLSKTINKFFRDEIILDNDENKIEKLKKTEKGELPSERKLRHAYVKIFESLEEMYDSIEGGTLLNKLLELGDSLEYRQLFLSISVQEYSDAYTIFETINQRGRPLTLSDLVKNLCFHRLHDLGDEALDEFESEWDEVEQLVSDFGLFMWHTWVSRHETCPRNRVFPEIEAYVKAKNPDDVLDFATEIIFEEAKWYHEYENPTEESGDEISKEKRRYLDMLKTMGATRCYPLLLSIDYAEKKKKTIARKEAAEMVKIVTCLTFWHSGICEKDAKRLEGVYHKLARQIREKQTQVSKPSVGEMMDELGVEFPYVVECKNSFETKSFTNDSLTKMLLRNIELSKYSTGEKTLKDDTTVWLEHILPRSPGGDSVWVETFPDESERRECTHKIGNLTLLLDRLNRDAKNYPFSRKKEDYKKSQIELTQQLTNFERWNAATVKKRTETLFELARQVWPIYSK